MEPPRFNDDKTTHPSFYEPPAQQPMHRHHNFYENNTPNTQTYPNNSYQSTVGTNNAFSNDLLSDPMMNIAKSYGQQFAQQGKQQIEKYVSINQLKYYFDVDNTYVGKKLALLLFPFAHTQWTVQYTDKNEPVPPRYDVNAPDLYIPVMAIVTYILTAGFALGIQDRFSPEQLGIYASSALMWLFFENILVLFLKYLLNISQSLRTWDTLAFCGYKYLCMNVCLIVYLLFSKFGYYCVLSYCSLATVFFLIRSVKGFVLENFHGTDGKKRKLYLLLFISLSQPFIIWWLTSSLTTGYKIKHDFEIPADMLEE